MSDFIYNNMMIGEWCGHDIFDGNGMVGIGPGLAFERGEDNKLKIRVGEGHIIEKQLTAEESKQFQKLIKGGVIRSIRYEDLCGSYKVNHTLWIGKDDGKII